MSKKKKQSQFPPPSIDGEQDGGIKVMQSAPHAQEATPQDAEPESQGLGVFGDVDHAPALAQAQEKSDSAIVNSMRKRPVMDVCGVSCWEVSLETLAMLQQIKSPFVTFVPKMTPRERVSLQSLAKRVLTPKDGDKALTQRENAELERLKLLVAEENDQLGNVLMAILEFFAIHSPAISDDDREEMVFGEPKLLRKAALGVGRGLPILDMEEVGRQIGQAIADAKSTKVRPVSKDPTPRAGNL